MYLLDGSKLELGDIILIKSESRISQMVRRLTESQFSHAILYVDVMSIIDSDGYGVQSNNLQRLLIESKDDAVVLRIKDESKKRLIIKAEQFARQKIGTEYSTDEAKIAIISKELEAKEPNRQFCTRFIAQAYENAGIKLVQNSDYCVPEELLKSEELTVIENPLREASPKEIEFAKSESPLEKQVEIHNSILQKARELSGEDIQTFEQINKLIIKRSDIDLELTKFVSESGYLIMMEHDMEKNPWNYNAEKMIEHYKNPNQLASLAMFFASTEKKTRERLNMTIYTLIQMNKDYPREYFKMEIELYKKLIGFSQQREAEAVKVLKHLEK
ncbi:TPA: YiiX/YebB-like N1pC/P60 family cysteine hydrolase [Elizabethkingia anophelis]